MCQNYLMHKKYFVAPVSSIGALHLAEKFDAKETLYNEKERLTSGVPYSRHSKSPIVAEIKKHLAIYALSAKEEMTAYVKNQNYMKRYQKMSTKV